MAFKGRATLGMKRWQVCFYPKTDTRSNHDNDQIVYFNAPNRKEAEVIASEYSMRINNTLVRWIYKVAA